MFEIPDDGFLIVDLNSEMYSGMYAKSAEITFNLNEVDDNGNIIAPANKDVYKRQQHDRYFWERGSENRFSFYIRQCS